MFMLCLHIGESDSFVDAFIPSQQLMGKAKAIYNVSIMCTSWLLALLREVVRSLNRGCMTLASTG